MTEYITKAQALSAMRKATNCTWDDIWNTEYVLKSVPAADVVPVVHGEWLNGRTFLENAICSNCNTTYEAYYSKYKYCPRCGARMDEGESDD